MQRRWFFLEAARALEVIIFYFRIPPYRGEVIVLGEDDFEAWGQRIEAGPTGPALPFCPSFEPGSSDFVSGWSLL